MCPFYLAFVAVIVLTIILLTCTCSDSPEVIYISGFKEHQEKLNSPVPVIETKSGYSGQMPYSEVMNQPSTFSDPILSSTPSNDSNKLRNNMIKISAFDNNDGTVPDGFQNRHDRSKFVDGWNTAKSDGPEGMRSGFLTGFDAAKSDASEGMRSRFATGWDAAKSDAPEGFLTGFDTAKSDSPEGFMSGNSRIVGNINFISNEFQNPMSYYGSGVGGPDLSYM